MVSRTVDTRIESMLDSELLGDCRQVLEGGWITTYLGVFWYECPPYLYSNPFYSDDKPVASVKCRLYCSLAKLSSSEESTTG